MITSYQMITNDFDGYEPGEGNGGERFLIDVTVGPTWNGLMLLDHDGYGPLRVVSAWKAFRDGCEHSDGYDKWGEVVAGCIEEDLGPGIAASNDHEAVNCYRIFWSYGVLYQALGEDWPIKALEFRLRTIEKFTHQDAEAFAKTVWERALAAYDAYKHDVTQRQLRGQAA